MKPLEAMFESQKQAASPATAEEAAPDERAAIRFTIDGSLFVVDIGKVVEVTELAPVVRYPEAHFGHVGIVNLRGNIVPVLSFRDHQPAESGHAAANRLLVLEFSPGRRFCTPVSAPKKVSLANTSDRKQPRMVTIDDQPATIVTEQDFPACLAEVQGGT